MTIAFPHPTDDSNSIEVNETFFTLNAYVIDNPQVVDIVKAATNPGQKFEQLLAFGAHVHELSSTTAAAEHLDATANEVRASVQAALNEAVAGLRDAASALADPESGQLVKALDGFRAEFGKDFDLTNTESIPKRIEEAARLAMDAQIKHFKVMIDPAEPDSLMQKANSQVAKVVEDGFAKVAAEFRDLSERLAARDASAATMKEVGEKLTSKGVAFEDLIQEFLEPIATDYGAVVTGIGKTKGVMGTDKGDILLTFDPDEMRGRTLNVVLEAKDQSVSKPKTFAELEAAMANREAVVAIAIFARQDQAPAKVPFVAFGARAILVLDKDDPDPYLLRFAFLWAREQAKRTLSGASGVDLAKIDALKDDALRAIDDLQTVKTQHTTAKKAIDLAGDYLQSMKDKITTALNSLEAEICKSE